MADLDLYTDKSSLVNFADDTQSWVIADSEEECKRITKEEANKVIDFFSANYLVILGIHISSDFTWNTHIEKLKGQLYQRIGLLSRIRYKITRPKVFLVAEPLFQSKICYRAAVYFKPVFKEE